MLAEAVERKYGKTLDSAENEEIYFALLELAKDKVQRRREKMSDVGGKKKLYYISAEFLVGKLLSNNLINLGIYEDIKGELQSAGKELSEIEEVEPEPSLGNGGLGRLAACFLDSVATLGLCGDGVGLNYHFGLFKQLFRDNSQYETPDRWMQEDSWLRKTDKGYTVDFKGFSVKSMMYDIDVTGFEGKVNSLHLFDLSTVDEGLVKKGISFAKTKRDKNLTLFLYPDDSDVNGRKLRIYQQYFMVANAARLILDEAREKGSNLHDLRDYAVVQINDTHPSMIIPELIRLLMLENIGFEEARDITAGMCAYTNHTILAEALEKWPLSYLRAIVPQLVPIIEKLDREVKEKYDDSSLYIIDKDKLVHMASMDIHYGFSVNGVAALHTEILKNTELHNFYKIYPEKFNNKTNGVTFRRWLVHCNPRLCEMLRQLIGGGFIKDASKLAELTKYVNDEVVLKELLKIKRQNKEELKSFLLKTQGVEIDADSVYDIQIKRLHEYKRQQLNALYIIDKYFEIKAGKLPDRPITVIFGAKAAPAYTIAKDIIHLILCLQQIINSDRKVSKYLKVIMVENYNVTKAEKLIPACDISEQISLASKEASGTGNMKFMLNGAVTLGTMDGANVEIHDLVGDENIYIFGATSSEVIERYKKGDYSAKSYYKTDARIRKAVNFITSKKMLEVGNEENLRRLKNELISKDWFMTFPDFHAYIEAKEKALSDYEDRKAWAKKMLLNIANAGYFSSDRSIEEYERDIWKLK